MCNRLQAGLIMKPSEPDTVESPCIGVCTMDSETNLCSGCYRTIDEIAAWSTLSNQSKLQILAAVRSRGRRRRDEGDGTPPPPATG